MPDCKAQRAGQAGFTLIEIMVALAILGTSLFVLLDMHYNAVHVQERLENEVKLRNLLSDAAGIAEVEIATGTLKDRQEFGDRYPGYSYSFDAELVDAATPSSGSKSTTGGALSNFPGLYDVLVTVEDPDKTAHELHFYCMARDVQAALGQSGAGSGDAGDGAAGGGQTPSPAGGGAG